MMRFPLTKSQCTECLGVLNWLPTLYFEETAEGAYWAEKEMDDGGAGIEFREYESHHTGTEAIEAAIAR